MALRALNRESRTADLEAMARDGVDVLVIGGGITGAGVALDAATRGYSVGLVEKNDFASGTSSWSTKLVHGGIRYLPQGDVPLVREALIERGRLIANAPHLVHPLSFVLPLYASSRHPVGLPVAPPGGVGLGPILDLGLTAYDTLAGRHNVARHTRLTVAETLARAQCLRPEGLKRGFVYTDAQTDDTRLTLAVLRSATEAGARLANYAEVVGFDRQPNGHLSAAHVRLTALSEQESPREIVIPARHIVNATGIWAERVEALAGETPQLNILPSKGVHLVVRREALACGDDAIVLPETADRRIVFLVPWRSRLIIGTTDEGEGDLDTPLAGEPDVDYLLDTLNRWVRQPLARDDILGVYAGYRPLLRLRHARTPARLSRSHAVVEGAGGLISVSGGKLTTYRRMACDVVDRVAERDGARLGACVTANLPLAGGAEWPAAAQSLNERARRLGLSSATATHLGGSYGTLATEVLDLVESTPALGAPLYPDLPAIWAEVVYAAEHELAMSVTDALERRLRIALEAADHGVGVSQRAAELLGGELGWNAETRQRAVGEYAEYVRRHESGLRRHVAGEVT